MPQRRILYVSGEESEKQIKLRADRIHHAENDVMLLCETQLDQVFRHIREVTPDLVVIDSIQTISIEVSTPRLVLSPKFANALPLCSNLPKRATPP